MRNDDPLDPAMLLLLLIGGVSVWISYKDPVLGAAILVGVGVVTFLYFLMHK